MCQRGVKMSDTDYKPLFVEALYVRRLISQGVNFHKQVI